MNAGSNYLVFGNLDYANSTVARYVAFSIINGVVKLEAGNRGSAYIEPSISNDKLVIKNTNSSTSILGGYVVYEW